MDHAGIDGVSALARVIGLKQPTVHEVVSGARDGFDTIERIAQATQCSAVWLRTGDPVEAPLWADRKRSLVAAAQALSERDRLDLIRQLDKAGAGDDVAGAPAASAAELAMLRRDTTAMRTALKHAHAQLLERAREIERVLAAIGDGVDQPIEPVTTRRAASVRSHYQIPRATAKPPQERG